jgi:outer membrane biosynthesis protein TonB
MAEDDGTGNGAAAPGPVPEPIAPADAPLAIATSRKAEVLSVAASAVGHLLVGLLVLGWAISAHAPPHVIPVKLIPADQAKPKPQKKPSHPPQKKTTAPAKKAAPPPQPKQSPKAAPPPKTAPPSKSAPPQKAAAAATAGNVAPAAKALPPPAKAKAPVPAAKAKTAEAKKETSWKDLMASLGMASFGRKTTLPKTVLAALSAQVKRCWTVPQGWSDPRQVSVTVRFQLHRDGTLDGDPAIVEFPATPIGAAAAKAALVATKKCGPYHLPAAQYDQWKDIQLSLKP